ncbi:pentatricopeptide repeat-containing protein At5g02830, chloroplastic-like [Zingiber officinale]|uniref:PROP1-like PPR domain-containing protein n=1 Tax=Zingiber officinale TaxID=94328 RepID=A0A8J5G8M5_ZINOF|nr:pentatricopeptide repeat-containing protein At5g02830, chloroplastic-like [Zingiber officinale]KAG6499882.1 hypothetical protein ZIOFF_039683 [Zingiber officinale]
MSSLAAVSASSSAVLSSTSAASNRKPSPPRSRKPPRRPAKKPLLADVRLAAPRHNNDSDAPDRHLLKHYASLASKLAKSGKLRDFLMIAEGVIAAGFAQFVVRIDPRMISEGIVCLLRDGSLAEVVEFASEAERIGLCLASLFDESALEALRLECRRLLDDGRLEQFVELMETLAGYQFTIKDIVDPEYGLSKIIQRGDPELAVRYASVFPHFQLLFCSILEKYGKKQDIVSATKAFEIFKKKSGGLNMFAWRAMIDLCGHCGDFLKSRSIFEELLTKNIMPNIYVLNSLMNVNAHDLSYTFHIYKRMQDLGVTADVTSYNILLKACCNAKRVDLALEVYEEITLMASKGALILDVFTYSTMIKVFADAKMWQMALHIREDMLSAGVVPNIVIWSTLLSACANAGLVDPAIQLFEEMLVTGCEPNAQCCNTLLHACVESCQYDRAFRLFYTWKETGFKICFFDKKLRYYSRVISSGMNNRDGTISSKLTSMQDGGPSLLMVVPFKPTVPTFNILMKACGSDFYRAKALMDEMKTIGLTPNHISWSTLIDSYGAAHNLSGAMQAFRAMQDGGMKLDVAAYTTAIKACVENKNLRVAYSLYEEMKRYQIQPNLVTYNTMLRARDKYGSFVEVQQCLAIYQDMRKSGYRSNDYYLKELIEEWCEGVLCSQCQSHKLPIRDTGNETNSRKCNNLLLEKVALHLRRDIGDRQAIDIRGLTKIEARIVVLSVLRMIKESYLLGKAIQDDMIIITDVVDKGAARTLTSHNLDVQRCIVKVLQEDLSFDLRTGHGALDDPFSKPSTVLRPPEAVKGFKFQARRPQNTGMIKVTKESLLGWLQRKDHRSSPEGSS